MNDEDDKLTAEQKEWYALLRLVDSFYFLLNEKCCLTQKTQGGYNHIQLSIYLNNLALMAKKNCEHSNPFRQDEFSKIAIESIPALTKIMLNIRTKLVRETCKLHISKIKEISPQTVAWLAGRPQENLADKIKPSNTILTRRVIFSADTVENRTLKYFYNLLYRYVSALLEKSGCTACEKIDECENTSGINTFLSLKNRIRQNELSNIIGQLYSMPNNVLLCDKYYNVIWRSVSRIRKTEERIKKLWEFLPKYILQLQLLIKAVGIISDKKGRVFESIITYEIGKGIVKNGKPLEHIKIEYQGNSVITLVIENEKIITREERYGQ
jgi:hypothetical protein